MHITNIENGSKRVSISKAMKLKSRMAGRISQLEERIKNSNSLVAGNVREVDVASLLQQRNELSLHLAYLKAAIVGANIDHQLNLEMLREKQALCSFLKGIDTKNGPVVDKWHPGEPVVYEAQLTLPQIDAMKAELQEEIDNLQDQIDSYNAMPNMVEVYFDIEKLIYS